MPNYQFITVGGATEDITFYTKEGLVIDNSKDLLKQKLFAFEYGAKIKIDNGISTFGGGAANAAVCLASLGLKSAAIVSVGKDARGESIIKNFKDRGVDASLVQVAKEATGYTFLLVGPGHEHVGFSNRGANKQLKIRSKESEAIKNSKNVYITSLSGKWQATLKNIFKIKGPKFYWNPGHIQLKAGMRAIGRYLSLTEALIVNKDEALELVYSDAKNRHLGCKIDNLKSLLLILKSYGPRLVLITNGKHGAECYDGKNFFFQPILKEKKNVDTTGVGDAFGSSFMAGQFLYKGDIAKSLYLGAKNTASVIGQYGAQNGLLKKKDLEKIKWKK